MQKGLSSPTEQYLLQSFLNTKKEDLMKIVQNNIVSPEEADKGQILLRNYLLSEETGLLNA